MRKIQYIIVLVGAILAILYFVNKKQETIVPAVIPPVVTNTEPAEPIELCFAKFGVPDKNGNYEKYTLRLILDGEKVTGELNLLPAEKDMKTGDFRGTVSPVDKITMARTADLEWFTFAEGINTKEELRIIFGEGTASIPAYTLSLTDVACADLAERANVENYLREDISNLSPVQPVLGGTWYVVSVVIDLGKNSGTVIYEDGHIQEKRNFTYVANDKQEIVSMVIN